MKKLLILLGGLIILFSGCTKEEDTLTQQQQKIVSYLQSTHAPKLVAYSAEAEEGRLAYYTVSGGVYRYIPGVYDSGRPSRPEVNASSKVTITFRAYVLTYANITDDTFPFYSNDPLLESRYQASGLNTDYWSFEPLVVNMSGGDILKGLRSALLGCREGDEVEAYMAYNVAYDDKYFSTIAKESPVALLFTISKVE